VNERTAYQSGYEDAHDRGWLASGLPKNGDIGEYRRGYHDGEEEIKKRLPSNRIAALEAQVKALTAERDSLQDAVDFLNTMNDEQNEWFTRIVNDHGGWHEDLPTGEAHIEEIIGNLKKDRDAQAEAVRVLGHRVRSCEHMLACYRVGRRPSDVALDAARYTAEAVDANAIARAAVEGGKRED